MFDVWFERLILLVSFVGVCVFVWKHIASDLPDDFLVRARKKEFRDGGVRDNR